MSTPLLLLLAAAPAASADVSGPDIVSYVNSMRAAQGIPAGISEDTSLSAACRNHDRYGAANDLLTHDEISGKPGFTDSGSAAAKLSVLYAGDTWTAKHDPFELAPIHLHQLLAPRLLTMGAGDVDGFGCATTLTGRSRQAPADRVIYTYPGPGAVGWATAQVARESPQPPGSLVGIPQGTRTGPYLYVTIDGPDVDPAASAHLTGASLSGPAGDVPVATVDNTTPGLGTMIPPGGEIIPRSPLAPNATYTASVTAEVVKGGSPGSVTRTWSFTTGPGGSRPGISDADDLASTGVATNAAAKSKAKSSSSSSSSSSSGALSTGTKPTVRRAKALATVASIARLRGKNLRVTVNCRAACNLATSGKLKLPGRRSAAFRAKTTLHGAGKASITVRLGAADAKRARRKHLGRPLTVTIVATAASGSRSNVERHLPVRKG